jgi:hypothetical protein
MKLRRHSLWMTITVLKIIQNAVGALLCRRTPNDLSGSITLQDF